MQNVQLRIATRSIQKKLLCFTVIPAYSPTVVYAIRPIMMRILVRNTSKVGFFTS